MPAAADLAAPAKRGPSHPLLAARASAVERHPALNKLLGRVALLLAEPSRLLPGVEFAAAVSRVGQQTLGDVLDTLPGAGVVATFRAEAWNAPLSVVAGPATIFDWVEAAFGGDGLEDVPDAGRPLSRTDIALARSVLEVFGSVLEGPFSTVRPGAVVLDTVQTELNRIDPDARRRRVVGVRIDLTLFGRTNAVWLALPPEMLPSGQQGLSDGAARPPAPAPDPIWRSRFGGEVTQTDIRVRAVIKNEGLTLGDVAALKVGQILRLDATSTTPVLLETRNRRLFWGQLGQSDERYTVRLDREAAGAPSTNDRPIQDGA